jgi:ribosome maturation factor RimP
MAAVSRHKVQAVLHPVIAAAGFDLEDVTVAAAGRRSVLRVIVDRDGGLDLDAVAEVSRIVSASLDDTDVMGDPAYTLEVSSPGIDRALTEPRHWRRATGRLVTAALSAGGSMTGRVLAADDATVTFEVAGETSAIPYASLGPGHVQLEFDR